MIIFARVSAFSRIPLEKKISVPLLLWALLVESCPQKLLAYQNVHLTKRTAQAPRYMQWSAGRLQQFVALIALYPDSLVSKLFTASTFIEQRAENGRWVRSHPGLKSDALGQAVDQQPCQQPWPYSIVAFASFSSVLGNVDKNRSGTSSPGKACNKQEHDVMDAAQVVRRGAQAFGNLKTTQEAVTVQSSMGLANKPWGGSVVGSDEDYNRPIATARLPNGNAQAVLGYAGLHDQSGVGSDAFRDSDHQEQQKKTDSTGQTKWQVGTVTAVRPYKVPNADPSVTSYKVSVRVGNTVYVVLNTPRPGTDIGIYARGRQVPVLIGEHTITYNDRLGNSFQVPILSRTTVTPRDSR